MSEQSKYFLVNTSYLGFRYFGVQKHGDFLTIASQVEKVIESNRLPKCIFKFSSRTDAKVSSLDSYILFKFEKAIFIDSLKETLKMLPQDIQVKSIRIVDEDFNLLNNIETKTYRYHFVFGLKEISPFWAPTIAHFKDELDLEQMQIATEAFLGTHDFRNLSYKVEEHKQTQRTIYKCDLFELNLGKNELFHPEKVHCLEVNGDGFLRGQVRMMMGALIQIGKGELSISRLSNEILKEEKLLDYAKFMVSPTGLMLYKTHLKSN